MVYLTGSETSTGSTEVKKNLKIQEDDAVPKKSVKCEGPDLTPRQQEYVNFVTKVWEKMGYGPSESDISKSFLISQPSAHSPVVTGDR